MEEEAKVNKCKSMKCGNNSAAGGAVYCLGLIGAAVYYIQFATTFWGGVIGILKALIWPGMVVYELLKFLGA